MMSAGPSGKELNETDGTKLGCLITFCRHCGTWPYLLLTVGYIQFNGINLLEKWVKGKTGSTVMKTNLKGSGRT
jgi:hypothetical protein